LAKHWPESEIYGDIRTITNTEHDGGFRAKEAGADSGTQPEGTTRQELPINEPTGTNSLRPTQTRWDLLTGGFPCQPFSAAGKRKGTSDDRHLWPEMLRVIQLTQPTWIIGENVPGIISIQDGLVFEQVCTDLENEGYEVQPFIIPACSVNAPHRRDRVWIVANNTISQRSGGWLESDGQILERQSTETKNEGPSWEKDWLEVATELCGLDDGLPVELGDFTLTKSGHRREQLKAYGNAIVPQVAIEIMTAIKESYE
jgi:DNA (cytosine-5)-methyltransferase 1